MSRVTENERTLEQVSKIICQIQLGDTKMMTIPISGILSDISRSLAVIADAIKDQENTDAEAK